MLNRLGTLPPWKTQRVNVRLTVTLSARLKRAQRNAQLLASEPSILAALLRQAAIETILVRYRERFLARLPLAVAMQRQEGGAQLRNSAQVRAKRARLRARLQSVYAMPRSAERSELLAEAQEAYSSEMRLYRRSKRSLPSGRFRSLAFSVLGKLADQSAVKMLSAGKDGSIRLGIGSKSALDRIETPSATPELTGSPTSSPHKILWRHLEFGTGVYRSKLAKRRATRFRINGGGWFFGDSPKYGLRLKGSQGVHALWTKEGEPYTEDAQALRRRFNELLIQQLFGS